MEENFTDKFLKSYRRGDTVFEEGSVGQQMYVVASGTVDIVRSAEGRGERIATLAKGDIFGEMALLDHLPRSASAVAAEDSQLLEIDHPLFVYLVTQQPAFALFVQKSLSLRLRGLSGGTGGAAGHGAPTEEGTKVPEPVALRENVHLLRGKCNCYLVRGSRKTILVDAGLPWEKKGLEEQLASLGLAPEDVDMVVLTHEHLDHIGGVPLFPRRTVVAAHSLAANKIGMQDEFVLMSKAYRLNAEEYHVDVHLHHGTKLDLGGCSLHVLHSPGHSSGSFCLYEPDQELLFTGDTIFANGILGGIFPSGSLSDYTWTLRQLKALKLREIYPGHGKKSSTPEEDFEKAIRGSLNLMNDTRSLFAAFDSREEFAEVSKAVSAYAKRV
jgi:glyoxylase-like metal-dependent hydrolase (beta-lactamase superfamily II)